jgi:predicted permease
MRLMRIVRHRVHSLLRRSRAEADLGREIAFHVEQLTREYVADGMSESDARLLARREFGSESLVQEQCRDMRRVGAVEDLARDVAYAWRILRKSPGFAVAAVVSLALGIGANTALFSVLNALVLRPLPVPSAQRLVQLGNTRALWETGGGNANSLFSYPEFEQFQAQSVALSGIFAHTDVGRVGVDFAGTAATADADAASGGFFAVLGLTPRAGHFFADVDDRAAAAVAVISDRYWRSRFAANPATVGASILVNRVPFTVIGITPPEFLGVTPGGCPDLWVPLRAIDRLKPGGGRQWTEPLSTWLTIGGRLRDGASREQAQAEFEAAHRGFVAERLAPGGFGGREDVRRFASDGRIVVKPAAAGMDGGIRSRYEFTLELLMAVAAMVLLIACANLANLLLAKASNRRREIALRLSLGAGRSRIVRQLLTESVLLAAAGGAVALPIAWRGSIALVWMMSTGDAPVPLDVSPDWRVFVFTAAISLFTGVLFGLAPALRSTSSAPASELKDGPRPGSRRPRAFDRVLVAGQVALSVVLVSGAGLFIRTVGELAKVDVGFDRSNVLMLAVDTGAAGYEPGRAAGVYDDVLGRLRLIPGVRSAAASIVRPVDDQFHLVDRVDEVDGRRLPESGAIQVAWNAVSPGYFATVSTPVLAGRDFNERDRESSPKVVIVNESFAYLAFGSADAVGRRLADATIVGIVRDSRYRGARDQTRPVLYYPLFQAGARQAFHWGYASFEIRYSAGTGLLDAVRREVAVVDRGLPVFRVRTLEAQLEQSLRKERLMAALSTVFGVLALLLACIGLSGLMGYAVAGRTAEIGLRMALGAQRPQVVWLVMRDTVWLTLAGIAAGVPLALSAAHFAASLLFGVDVADPTTLAATVALLAAVAALASYLPVRRALRLDPIRALRCE